MTTIPDHFLVQPSTLPGTGKGLFTTIAIKKGARVIEYEGTRTSWAAVKDDIENDYIYYVSDDLVIDAKLMLNSLGRYANDANGVKKVEGIRNNCVYQRDGDHVYIIATKDIDAGEEIFVQYGKDYWLQEKKNRAIAKRRKK